MAFEEDLQYVADFTNTTREQALFLINKYGDKEKAVQSFYDEGAEKAFQNDKRGWDEAPPYHEAEIPYGPAPPDNSMLTGAPSRPPSRINSHRSLVDLTQDHNQGMNLSREQQEEQDYQQAISNSMSEVPAGQQTGVTGAESHFGPANKDFYEKDSWAMVPTSISREVIHQPEPIDRLRKAGQPAFLRPSSYQDRLPSLLTIYHSIPLARDALMLRDVSIPRYGYDDQWWNGAPIHITKINTLDEDRRWEDVIYEVQRIMAFLDSTHRAYGSTEAFATLEWYHYFQSETELTKFLESWDRAVMYLQGSQKNSAVFGSVALKNEDGSTDRGAKKDFYCLEPPIEPDDRSLYDVLDRVIWHDTPGQGYDDTFIAQLGEIFTGQFLNEDNEVKGCNIDFPAVWYPDRYLEEYRKEALDMRQRAQEHRHAAYLVDRRAERLINHRVGSGNIVDARDALLKAASSAEVVAKNKLPNGLNSELDFPDEDNQEISIAEAQRTADELRAIVERIDRKVASLASEKDKALKAFGEVSSELTQPTEEPRKPPNHKYTLQGVATLPHVTYFKSKREPDLLVSDDDIVSDWQWWRVSYSREDAKLQREEKEKTMAIEENKPLAADEPGLTASQLLTNPDLADSMGYTMRVVTEEEVLRAAREESKSVLVVYASEKAVAHEGLAMNNHLQMFVDTDNDAFASELKGEVKDDGDLEMISNKSSATLANDDFNAAVNDDSDLEPLININSSGEDELPTPLSPQSAVTPHSAFTVSYPRGMGQDESHRSPKRSKGFDERIPYAVSSSSSQAFGEAHDESMQVDEASEKAAGAEHVEYMEKS